LLARAKPTRTRIKDRVAAILARHELVAAYSYFVEHNPGNDQPYHNRYHTDCMILNCAAGAADMRLAPEETRILLLSAIFHDFGHSGGKYQDDHNIEVALEGLTAYCGSSESLRGYLTEAVELVKSTRFPYVTEPQTLSQKIIRDADQMQMYMPGWKKQIFTGMRKEIEIASGKELTLSDMIRIQLKFMAEVQWQTAWAQERAKNQWGGLMEKVKSLAVEG